MVATKLEACEPALLQYASLPLAAPVEAMEALWRISWGILARALPQSRVIAEAGAAARRARVAVLRIFGKFTCVLACQCDLPVALTYLNLISHHLPLAVPQPPNHSYPLSAF